MLVRLSTSRTGRALICRSVSGTHFWYSRLSWRDAHLIVMKEAGITEYVMKPLRELVICPSDTVTVTLLAYEEFENNAWSPRLEL